MKITSLLFVLLLTIDVAVLINGHLNPLNSQHLRVIWPRWQGNPKGLTGPAKGGAFLDYLSARFNFTYEMVRVTENTVDPSEQGRGFFNYLWDGQCDLLVTSVVPANGRNKVVDLTWPYIFDSCAFLIPVADDQANITAIIKPFQWPVWLSLAVSIICVIFIFNQITKSTAAQRRKRNRSMNSKMGQHYLFVVGNLLAQGEQYKHKRLSFRFVAGVWVPAAFVFVQAYNATLFLYVMAPITSPLINSAYDVAESQDINMLVRKGGTMEHVFKGVNVTLYKKLQARIEASINYRCTLVSECISMVKPGTKNVYLDAKTYQIQAISENFKKTGKCNYMLAKEYFINSFASFALPKNSPYTKTVSKGLLEIQEIGLFVYWDVSLTPTSRQCLTDKAGYKTPAKKTPPALTLKNLTGAFVVLLIGTSLSVLAFLYEQIISLAATRRVSKRVIVL